jgi:Glycosyl hydrolase family 26
MAAAINISRRGILHGAAATLAVTQLSTTAEAAAALPRLSGLAWPSGATDYVTPTLAGFRARPLDVRVVFGKRTTWQDIRTAAGFLAPLRGNGPERLVVTYYPFPVEQSPGTGGVAVWRAAARGDFDHHHVAAARTFARSGKKLIFRIGHEWNSGHIPWSCLDVALAPYYKDYFRRISDILRKYNRDAMIDWCSVKRGEANAGIQNFYPGSSYVDFIGCDRYDFYPALTTPAAWRADYNSTYRGGPAGIGAWLAYAKSQGKKFSVAEWGVVKGSPSSGGDNAPYVENMLRFFRTNASFIGFESYFNVNNGGWVHRLQDNSRAGAAYRRLSASGGA